MKSVLRSALKKTVQNVFFFMETVMHWTACSDDATVATMAAEKAILCVVFEEFSEPDETGINMWLILQNTLHVTVTELAVQNKREYSNPFQDEKTNISGEG